MTYCAALRLKEGMIFASDTRTNAGVDHISTFRKIYTYGVEGERFIVLQTAGIWPLLKQYLPNYKMILIKTKSPIYIQLPLYLMRLNW